MSKKINLNELCLHVLRTPSESDPGVVLAFTRHCNETEIKQLAEALFELSSDLYVAYVRHVTRYSESIIARSKDRIVKFLRQRIDLGARIEIVTNSDKYPFAFSIYNFARGITQYKNDKIPNSEIIEAIYELIQIAIQRSVDLATTPSAPAPTPRPDPPPRPPVPAHVARNNLPPPVLEELRDTVHARGAEARGPSPTVEPSSQRSAHSHLYEELLSEAVYGAANRMDAHAIPHVIVNPERYLENLQKFDNKGDREIESFFNSFEQACIDGGIVGNLRVHRLNTCLREAPLVHLEGILARYNNDITYAEVKRQLILKFSKRKNATTHLREMANRVFVLGVDTLDTYFDDKMHLIDRAEPHCTNQRRVELIIEGLPAIARNVVQLGNYQTADALYEALKNVKIDDGGISALTAQVQKLLLRVDACLPPPPSEQTTPPASAEVNALDANPRRSNPNRSNPPRQRPNPNPRPPQPPRNQQRGYHNNPPRGQYNRGNRGRSNEYQNRRPPAFGQGARNQVPRGNAWGNFGPRPRMRFPNQGWFNGQGQGWFNQGQGFPPFAPAGSPHQPLPLQFTAPSPMYQKPCVVCQDPSHDVRSCANLLQQILPEPKNSLLGQPR